MLDVCYAKRMMSTTIEHVAKSLGVSVRGVRLRVEALDGLIKPHLQRGANNQLIFTGEAVGILQRLEELRHRDGVSVKVAASILRQSQNDSEDARQPSSKPTTSENLLRELIEEKERRIHALEGEVSFLRRRVEELTPLALPRPRRLWAWIRGRVVQRQSI